METIAVIGRDVIPQLREYLERLGFHDGGVSYSESVRGGRMEIQRTRPAVVVVGFPCGADHCPQSPILIREAREANPNARVILLGESSSSSADVALPWPVGFQQFVDALHEECWASAVAEGGWRGHMAQG